MSQVEPSDRPPPSASTGSAGRWMALIAALLGWMFDGAEMGLFSMVGRSAIQDLMGFGASPTKDQEAQIGFYFGVVIAVFLVGAATGGVLFGWLGDRIGRVRAMSLSVITYALFTGLCGVAQSPLQIAVLRFIAALGMGGEWSLGVALVMEVWPNRSRSLMAGLIGAAANVGYMLVGIIGLGLAGVLDSLRDWLLSTGLRTAWVESLVAYKGWRVLMLLGAAPALLTFLFRLFVPESEKWQSEHGKGATSHWAGRDLWGVLLGALGPGLIIVIWSISFPASWSSQLVAAVRLGGSALGLAIATAGYTYPVVRYLQRCAAEAGAPTAWQPTIRRMLLGAGLSGVALLGTWGSTQWALPWAAKLTDGALHSREWTQIYLAVGACVGTIGAAWAGDRFGRRITYCGLCLASLASAVWFFAAPDPAFNTMFLFRAFVAGACTASFYGWLPLYLPELFGTNIRATGQGFGFNFGRILAAIGALQTGALMELFKSDQQILGLKLTSGYPLACSTMSLIYLVGMGLIWLAPETKGQPLPD